MKRSIALLLTAVIAAAVSGCGALGSSSSSADSSSVAGENKITRADDHSILFVLDGEPASFMLMRSEPYDGELVFAGIPSDTMNDGHTLSELFSQGGGRFAESFTEQALDIDIDWYMVLTQGSFIQLCDMVSGDSEDYSGREVLGMITASGGMDEKQRADHAAEVVSAMVEAAGGEYLAKNIDGAFPILIRSTDNDIVQSDYDSKSYAIKELLRGLDDVTVYSFEGEYTEAGFALSKDSADEFREEYYE